MFEINNINNLIFEKFVTSGALLQKDTKIVTVHGGSYSAIILFYNLHNY